MVGKIITCQRWMKGDLINSPNRNMPGIKLKLMKTIYKSKLINTKMNDMNGGVSGRDRDRHRQTQSE